MIRINRWSVTLAACLFILSIQSYAQNSVGIGTASSNNHAVLELVSPGNNQGLLVPRLSTVQRTAPSLINSLSSAENSLLVFDSDLNKFYFWQNTVWVQVDQPQDLNLTGNILKITNNPGASAINLAPYAGTNTDNQTLSLAGTTLTISGGNSVNLAGVDKQDISLNTTTNILSLTNDATTVDLSPYKQSLSSTATGTQRTIAISSGTSTTIDVADADNSATNEIQTLSISGSTLSISSGNAVTLPSGITGSGATGQVTLWSSKSAVSGSAGFVWDDKNSRLGVNVAAPQGNLHVSGSQFASVNSVSIADGGTYDVVDTDYIIMFTSAAGKGGKVTLPDASTMLGRILIIRAIGVPCAITSKSGKDTIDNATGLNLFDGTGSFYTVTLVAAVAGKWLSISKSTK